MSLGTYRYNETMVAVIDEMGGFNSESIYVANSSNLSLDMYDTNSSTISVYFAVLFSIITFVAIFGNAVLIIVVVATKNLHTHQNILVVNLSMADMIVSAIIMPFSIKYTYSGVWDWGNFFCELWIILDVGACTASILTLCVIAGDRFVSISKPFYYASKISKPLIFTFIFFIWLFSLLEGIPIALKMDRPRNYARPKGTCDQIFNPAFSTISSLFSFGIPLIVMCTLYLKLYREAKRQSQRINANIVMSAQLTGSSRYSQQAKRRENKAAVTIGIIVGCFAICWTPYFIVNIVSRFPGVYISMDVYLGFTWLGYFNSAINPYLYVAFTHDIKTTIRNHFISEQKRRKALALRSLDSRPT